MHVHEHQYQWGKRRAVRRSRVGQLPTAWLLRKIAAEMLPFYEMVVRSRGFALAWSRAVAGADLDRMKKLLSTVAPRLAHRGMGTNGIGYFISFPAANSYYSAGITIPPGRVRFHFNPGIHRLMVRALIPCFWTMACRPSYAQALARAIVRNDRQGADRLVRCRVKMNALKSVRIEDGGLVLSFKYPYSQYVYSLILFREF